MNYYKENTEEFIQNTINVNMTELYSRVVPHFKAGGKILDLGCGAGRDLKYFKEQGFDAVGIEPCEELALYACEYSGCEVEVVSIEEFKTDEMYDAIWACASLLHIPRAELSEVFKKLAGLLRDGGVLYCSFKYGEFEGERDGRYFTDMDEVLLGTTISHSDFEVKELWITNDLRPGRGEERWLNVILFRF